MTRRGTDADCAGQVHGRCRCDLTATGAGTDAQRLRHAQQGSGPGTENAAQNAALLRDVTAQVSGTVTQLRAHEFLTYVGFHGGMERCFGEGDRIVALRGAQKPTTPSPSVDDAGYGPAMAKCGRSASNFQGMPSFAEPLLTELTSLVIKTVRSSGAKQRPEDYAACMAGHQVAVQSREEAVAQAGARYGEIWQSEDAKAWAQARELEVKAAVADAQCRTEAHETSVPGGPRLAAADQPRPDRPVLGQPTPTGWGHRPARLLTDVVR